METLEHSLVRCERLRDVRERFGIEDMRDALGFGVINVGVAKG